MAIMHLHLDTLRAPEPAGSHTLNHSCGQIHGNDPLVGLSRRINGSIKRLANDQLDGLDASASARVVTIPNAHRPVAVSFEQLLCAPLTGARGQSRAHVLPAETCVVPHQFIPK